ncbi:hypothetical protein FHS04_000088 [Mesoflavibacter sabulilitoris]|uniref:Uncharacterized protein n=1 Tax=Mesoflavibacter zeaxanthinifaciens subsp. sabulilitoris TaxID=1520893 RepID=A0A2T1NKL6_9FLAO|nr:hypothetical protein [Mesoflavibacter zeaxanthinifaciens]MBB3122600.1 hypothetical protein [Mesoflavibacter zeaxanthinifaciens subsp. sabulilitoris]MCP4051672.1 hypothetical protein [Mesoflavibacter sp.]PSG93444.1 hypothetical protein C7H61_02725 [Mesoflavibacter zeaxanthinifaciens subsp. sabulilitoris]
MTEHTQNIIYKWTLRARYIFVFILGAGLLSIGLESIVQPIIETNNKELQKIITVGAIIFGLIFIVFGFYYKKDIEIYIRQQQL